MSDGMFKAMAAGLTIGIVSRLVGIPYPVSLSATMLIGLYIGIKEQRANKTK